MISVIIPTYNDSQFIVQAVESVLCQTYNDYEIIVVDDGSTDGTKELLRPYFSVIRYFYKSNGGVASARNLGIENARGDYIAFLDSDDLWHPKKLAEVDKIIKSIPSAGLIHSDAYLIVDTEIVGIVKSRYCSLYKDLLLGNFIVMPSVVVKRECFQICGLFFEGFEAPAGVEDWDMWIRIARKYSTVHIAKPLVYYRLHGANRSNLDCVKMNKDMLLVLERADNDSLTEGFRRRIYSNAFYVRGLKYFENMILKDARKELWQSLRLFPFQYKAYVLTLASFLPIKLQTLKKLHLFLRRLRFFRRESSPIHLDR